MAAAKMKTGDMAKQLLREKDYRRGYRQGRLDNVTEAREKAYREGQLDLLETFADAVLKVFSSLNPDLKATAKVKMPDISLEDLGLKATSQQRLRKRKIHSTADLLNKSETKLRSLGIGATVMKDIRACLKQKGYRDLDG